MSDLVGNQIVGFTREAAQIFTACSYHRAAVEKISRAAAQENQQSAYAKDKYADQLQGNREADQCLCFCYKDSTIPLLSKSKISSLYQSSEIVQTGLC